MIELTREDFSMVVMDLLICGTRLPVTDKTHAFIDFLWECYKDNKHIITIGVK